MKKFISLMMAVMLLLSAMPSFASEKETNFNYEPFENAEGGISNIILYQGKLVGIGSKMQEIDIDTKETKLFAERDRTGEVYLSNMSAYKDVVYSFLADELLLTKVDIADGLIKKGEDVHRFEVNINEVDWESARFAFFYEDTFFANIKDGSDMTNEQFFLSYNLETKEEKLSNLKNISAAAPYKDGKLLVLLSDDDYAISENADFTLAVYDIASDTIVQELAEVKGLESYNLPRFFYYANRDSIYMAKGSEIFEVKDGKLEIVAYLPGASYGLNGLLELPDGRMAFAIFSDNFIIAVRDLDPAKKPERSIKLVNSDEYYLMPAIKKMADVPVVAVQDYSDTAQDMAAKIISAGNSYDVVQLNPDFIDINSLIKKGYLAEIKSEKLIAFANSLAEPIKEVIFNDGKLYALPQTVQFASNVYDTEGFKELGLEAPTSYMDMLKDYYAFETGDEEAKEKYTFYNNYYSLKDLRSAVKYYSASKAAKGEDVVFNTPEFKELIAQVKKNANDIKEIQLDWEDSDEVQAHFEKINLINYVGSVSPDSFSPSRYSETERKYTLLKLPVFDGGEPISSLIMPVLVISSQSKNIDLGERLFENMVDTLNPEILAVFKMHLDGPIENKNFEKQKASMEQEIKQIKEAAEKLSGAEKENYLASYEYLLSHFDEIIESMRYAVKPDAVEVFNEFANQKLYVENYFGNIYSSNQVLTYDLEERFMNGTINEDMLASELDNKAKLVRLEQQ